MPSVMDRLGKLEEAVKEATKVLADCLLDVPACQAVGFSKKCGRCSGCRRRSNIIRVLELAEETT